MLLENSFQIWKLQQLEKDNDKPSELHGRIRIQQKNATFSNFEKKLKVSFRK